MLLNIEQQLARCKRVIAQRVRPHVHPVIAPLQVRAFDIPGEPMPVRDFFAKLDQGAIAWRPFVLGSSWGTTWGTVWFELRGRVPERYAHGHALELVIDLGWFDHSVGGHIEAMAYAPDGTAIKAVHPRNQWVPLIDADGTGHTPIDEDGHFTVYVEAACNPLILGPKTFDETELGECATGKREQQYVFRDASLTEYDRRFEAYWLDLQMIQGLLEELPDKHSTRYWQLAKALQRSLNAFDEQRLDSVNDARAELAGVLARPANASALAVGAVGHAHIDSAWLWPVRETRRKVARTVANVLALMDQYPHWNYAMSSAQQYAWLEHDHPDLFARVRRRVAEGRFIPVGGMWVESDGNLPAGESLIRQISFGKRYFHSRFGVEPRGIWLPDSFGYTGAWPQIARRAGYEWFLTQKISWNDTTKFPHHSFMWEGIDGTRILTHFPPGDTYSACITPQELLYTERNFQDKDLSDHALMLYGYGDGGGGPTREMLGNLDRCQDLEGLPRVIAESPDECFAAIRKQIVDEAAGETPVWHGELYLELHRATLTSQQAMKHGCRHEEDMLRAVEYLCATASLADASYQYPRQALDDIWTTLLLNQFHDILPGSAIAWVYREARAEYQRDLKRLEDIAEEACGVLRSAYPQAEVLKQARVSEYRGDGRSWLPVAATVHAADTSKPMAGSAIRPQSSVTLDHAEDGGVVLDNGLLHVVIAADGTVHSLIDLHIGRELVPSGARLGEYELLIDEPSAWDAWDIERDALLRAHAIGDGRIVSASADNDAATVVVSTQFGASEIRTAITLAVGARQLDFKASVDWHERERFLKVDVPVAVRAIRAQYDCQYGLVDRPIDKNTPGDEAQYEVCTRRFARIAQPDYAVAVVNDSIYGADATPIVRTVGGGNSGGAGVASSAGTMFRLSLLSAPVFPDPHEDQGHHEFAWSVVADATLDHTLESACMLNAPVLRDVPAIEPLVSLRDVAGMVVIDWIKLADDGSGDVIVRLYEAAGGQARARLHVVDSLAGGNVRETDVLERDALAGDLPVALVAGRGRQPVQGAAMQLGPFQLATLRISR